MIGSVPDASCEPDLRVCAAARQQLRVPAVPALLLPELRQQGEGRDSPLR